MIRLISKIRRYAFLLLFVVGLYSIQSCVPPVSSTPALANLTDPVTSTATDLSTPAKTPTPASPASLTLTPVLPGNFVLFYYPLLIMNYDASIWEDRSNYTEWGANLNPVPGALIQNYLQAVQFKSCQIGVIGPSGYFPPTEEVVELGDVRYQLSTSENQERGVRIAHYIEDHSLTRYNYDQYGLPVLEIAANPAEWNECKTLGEGVLSTLRSSTQ